MALYSLNAVIYSWVGFLPDFALASPSTFPVLHYELQSIRWWIDNFIFVLTDSPPSSGTDDSFHQIPLDDGGGSPSAVNLEETIQLESANDVVLEDRDHGGDSN